MGNGNGKHNVGDLVTNLTDLDSTKLKDLCNRFEFKNKKIVKLLLDSGIDGKVFEEYATYVKEEKDDAEDDLQRTEFEVKTLMNNLSERLVGIKEEEIRQFITQVIDRRLKEEKGLKETTFKSKPFTSSNRRSTTSSSSGIPQSNSNPKFSKYSPTDTIPLDHLYEDEERYVGYVKPKLLNCYEFYNMKGIKPSSVLYSSNLDADAQTLACKDRFIYHYFGFVSEASHHNLRDVDTPTSLQIKLVISEIPADDLYRKVASLISGADFGITHTALLMGQWRIEWFDTSLVSIKPTINFNKDSNTIAVIDLGTLGTKEEIHEAFKLITDICVTYNCTKEYNNLNCNCQHFVTDIVNGLNKINPSIAIPQQKSFQSYFKRLKSGKFDRVYKYSKSLRKQIKLETTVLDFYKPYYNQKKIVFNSRKEVDVFCYWLNSLDYFKTDEGKIDYILLKAFDRSFCLRANKDREVLTFDEGDERSFFSEQGKYDDNSLKKIVYNTQDLEIEIPKRFIL
ncbi:hypothetical protein ABK040_000970 [Willaertia magna]